MKSDLRTELAKAKGLGSSKSGAHHWWHQRFTAIIMIPLTIWLIFFIKHTAALDLMGFLQILQKPYTVAPLGLLAVTALYHSMLGMKVIIEDYVSSITARNILIISLQSFCLVTIVSLLIALLQVM